MIARPKGDLQAYGYESCILFELKKTLEIQYLQILNFYSLEITMSCARLFLSAFLLTLSIFVNAQSSTNTSDIASTEAQQSIPSYLKDLEELGYCIIPKILSYSETKVFIA